MLLLLLLLAMSNCLPLCGSRKYPYLPRGGLLGTSKGRGVSKPKVFKEKYEVKLEFPERSGDGRGGDPNQ